LHADFTREFDGEGLFFKDAGEQRVEAVPGDLNPDAEKDKCNDAQDAMRSRG
jgi:hypothetical protein